MIVLAVLGSMLGSFAIPAAAQCPGNPPPPSPLPKLVASAPVVADFAPTGWTIEKKVVGQIDGDDHPDVVMVIKDTSEANIMHVEGIERSYDSNPRVLVVILSEKSGDGFRLGEQNGTLIPRLAKVNQEDLFDDLTLKNGVIRVSMHEFFDAGGGDMGTTSFALRWDKGRLVMIGFDHDSTIKPTGETKVTGSITLLERWWSRRARWKARSRRPAPSPSRAVRCLPFRKSVTV